MNIRLFGKSVLIFWIFILAIIGMTMMLPANSMEIELGTGVTHYKHQHDGVWYQEAFPHSFDLNAVPMSLGVVFEHGDRLYRMEFLSLGSMFNKSVATPDNRYYPGTTSAPEVQFDGRGSVSGVILSAVRPVRLFGLPFYGEAGLFVFRHKWNVSLHDFAGKHLIDLNREPEINIGPVVGIGLRGKGLDIGIRYLYLDVAGGEGASATPPLATHAYTMMMKVYF